MFERAAELFSLLSAPARVRIVRELMEGERSVSDLVGKVGISQPNLSQHLAMLYQAGLVFRRREGAHVLYRIAGDRLNALTRWMTSQGC